MIFWLFGGNISIYIYIYIYILAKIQSTIMNVFIVFIKFLGWVVAIWVSLASLIEENGDIKFSKGPTTKIKYIITKIKNKNKKRT